MVWNGWKGTPTANTMSAKAGRITCRECKRVFDDRLEWMTNKVCENPNCRCPEVQRAMNMTTNAIEKAKTKPYIHIVKQSPVKEDIDGKVSQYYIEVPDVISTTIFRNGRRPKGV